MLHFLLGYVRFLWIAAALALGVFLVIRAIRNQK
jgi:hypothetical protein